MPTPTSRALPTLDVVLAHFEASSAAEDKYDLDWVIASKELSRDSFFDAGAWAIIAAARPWATAQEWAQKAERTGFPFSSNGWATLSDWSDVDFDQWCKAMASELAVPQPDLSGGFRKKWWWIWDLGWYLSQFEDEVAFRQHFFDGKEQGHQLTDDDVRRLAQIKRNEWPRLGGIDVANRYFILRNLGGDFLKPDVWINAFCEWYGNVEVAELAAMLRERGIHCGKFDAYCWAYCEREIRRSALLPAHLNAHFAVHADLGGTRVSGTTVADFEASVWRIERIRIVIREESVAAVTAPYQYRRAAADGDTVTPWLDLRVLPSVGGREVVVLRGDGQESPASAELGAVRESYRA